MNQFIITQSLIVICLVIIAILVKQIKKAPADLSTQLITFLSVAAVFQVVSSILYFRAQGRTVASRLTRLVSIIFIILSMWKMTSISAWIKDDDVTKHQAISALFAVVLGATVYGEFLDEKQPMWKKVFSMIIVIFVFMQYMAVTKSQKEMKFLDYIK